MFLIDDYCKTIVKLLKEGVGWGRRPLSILTEKVAVEKSFVLVEREKLLTKKSGSRKKFFVSKPLKLM